MQNVKTWVRSLAEEIIEVQQPRLFKKGAYGSVQEYASFLERILAGFGDLLTSERTHLTPAEKAFLRELADNPLLQPLKARAEIERVLKEWAG